MRNKRKHSVHNDWRLAMVTNALEEGLSEPALYTACEILEAFEPEPMAWSATPKSETSQD